MCFLNLFFWCDFLKIAQNTHLYCSMFCDTYAYWYYRFWSMSGLQGGEVLFLILLQQQKLVKPFVRIAWLFSRYVCSCIALLLCKVLVNVSNMWFLLMSAFKWRSFRFFKRGNDSAEDQRTQAIIKQARLLMYLQGFLIHLNWDGVLR